MRRISLLFVLVATFLSAASPRWAKGVYRNKPVTFQVVQGLAIYQGDIILGKADDLINAQVDPSTTQAHSLGIGSPQYLWTSAIVPYQIDPAIQNTQYILAAIQHWNDNTGIKIVPRTTQTNYVTFKKSLDPSVCYSTSIGMQGKEQFIYGGEGCATGFMVHEIGHAIGLAHEQARSDRNYYIRILYENMSKIAASQYQMDSSLVDVGPYDYASIMHYGMPDFTRNGYPVMQSRPLGIPIGNIDKLSAGDIDGVNRLYRLDPTNFTITTNPPGLAVIVDGEVTQTPVVLNWTTGSTHTLSVPDSQTDDNARYSFGAWSDEGDPTHTITASVNTTYFTAHMVRYMNLNNIAVDPPGAATVTVTPASPDGYYVEGSIAQIQVTPADGYYFANWTGVAIDRDQRHNLYKAPWKRIVEDYWVGLVAHLSKTPVTAITTALTTGGGRTEVVIDGVTYTTPVGFAWADGESHTVEPPISYPDQADTATQTWLGWSDGADRVRTVTGGAAQQLVMNYKTGWSIDYGVFPQGTGSLSLIPNSASQFYDEGSTVAFAATPARNYSLASWAFDLVGYQNNQSLTVNDYNLVYAIFAQIGQIQDNAVTNAATLQPTYLIPGGRVTVFSPGVGPGTQQNATPNANGTYPTSIGAARIYFDGVQAEIISAGPGVYTAVVPTRLASQNYSYVTLEYNGNRTNDLLVYTDYADPGIYTTNGVGTGQARALNDDLSPNGPGNSAARGAFLTFYMTGDGGATPGDVEVRIGSEVADVISIGPSDVDGMIKVQVKVPDNTPVGDNVTLFVDESGYPTQNYATVAIR